MKRTLTVLCLSAILLLGVTPCIPLTSAQTSIEVGDYWVYKLDQTEYEGIQINGTMEMEIASETSRVVGGVSVDAFLCELTGTGTVSGTFMNITATGTLTVTGTQVRLVSNFSLVSQTMAMSMAMDAMGFQMTMTFGLETNFNPPFDEYIGDDELIVNTVVSSSTQMTGSTYMNILDFNTSEVIDFPGTQTMRIVDSGVSVETDAGTFECYKINVTATSDDNTTYETLYYSEKVGNYVKYEGGDLTGGMLGGGMTLKSYSHGASSSAAILYIGAGVVAIVVVIAIILLLVMKKRGAAPVAVSPPPPVQ